MWFFLLTSALLGAIVILFFRKFILGNFFVPEQKLCIRNRYVCSRLIATLGTDEPSKPTPKPVKEPQKIKQEPDRPPEKDTTKEQPAVHKDRVEKTKPQDVEPKGSVEPTKKGEPISTGSFLGLFCLANYLIAFSFIQIRMMEVLKQQKKIKALTQQQNSPQSWRIMKLISPIPRHPPKRDKNKNRTGKEDLKAGQDSI